MKIISPWSLANPLGRPPCLPHLPELEPYKSLGLSLQAKSFNRKNKRAQLTNITGESGGILSFMENSKYDQTNRISMNLGPKTWKYPLIPASPPASF